MDRRSTQQATEWAPSTLAITGGLETMRPCRSNATSMIAYDIYQANLEVVGLVKCIT